MNRLAQSHVLERHIEQESRTNIRRVPDQAVVYILEWHTDGENIYGLGPDLRGDTAKIKHTLPPGVYGITSDLQLLKVVMNQFNYEVEDTNLFYEANNFPVINLLQNRCTDQPGKLVKIITSTFDKARMLHSKFKYSENMSRLLAVTQYYEPITQVQFDYIRKYTYSFPNVINTWINDDGEILSGPKPNIPFISFDIETVNSDPVRVPMGECENDELFTVAIYHSTTNIIYSLAFIPLIGTSSEYIHQKLLQLDRYEGYDEYQAKMQLEIYTTEVDLLKRTIDLLTMDNKFHFLVGYNSTQYDIKFLIVRCQFYNLSLNEFRYFKGFHLTFNQIHLDLFKLCKMKYDFPKYTLNFVVSQVLKLNKVDVNAVALRYTFHHIRANQSILSHEEYAQLNIPSLRDSIHYNNIDTLLVVKLIQIEDMIDYATDYCDARRITLSNINTIYNKMQFKILSELLIIGLKNNKFLSNIAACSQIALLPQQDDILILNYSVTDNLSSVGNGKFKQAKYPGGVNYCCKEIEVASVQIYDYRIAYPLLIDRANISNETCTITYASILLSLLPTITNVHDYILFDYQVHSASNKTLTRILIHRYVQFGEYCGGFIKFDAETLASLGNKLIIIIYRGRRGILSNIISTVNEQRENMKNRRKILDSIITMLETEKQEIQLEAIMVREAEKPISRPIVHASESDDEFGASDLENEVDTPIDDDDDFGTSDKEDNVAVSESDDNFGTSDKENVSDDDEDFGDDDFGASDGEISTTEVAKINVPVNAPSEIIMDVLKIYDDSQVDLDISKIREQPDPINFIDALIKQVNKMRRNTESAYRLQKACSASIYGCLGSLEVVVAAAITCIIRTLLLQASQFLTSKGCCVYFMDTDSIMVANPSHVDYSDHLNAIFPWTEIECKTIENIKFIQTKTYYYEQDGKLIYSQHKNGPKAWSDFVHYINKLKFTTFQDISRAFTSFFNSVYDRLDNDLNYVCYDVKVKSSYKTNTPGKLLMDYISKNYPTLNGQHKYCVYNHLNLSNILNIEYRPSKELNHPSQVNLFKFYLANFKTVFNLIKISLRKHNEGIHITLNEAHVRNTMLRSFMDVHNEKFNGQIQHVPDDEAIAKVFNLNYIDQDDL